VIDDALSSTDTHVCAPNDRAAIVVGSSPAVETEVAKGLVCLGMFAIFNLPLFLRRARASANVPITTQPSPKAEEILCAS
jgi:hypothetical protein